MNKSDIGIILIILLLLGATLGVIAYSKYKETKNSFIYHGANGDYRIDIFTSGNHSDYYIYGVSDNVLYKTPLRKTPYEVEEIFLEADLLSKLQRPGGTRKVYITQDYETPNKTSQLSFIASQDIGKILGNAEYGIYKLDVQGALTTSTERSRELSVPEITCANVNRTTSVIYLKLGEENKVYSENECIIVQGKNAEGLILSATKFAYYLLGVF